MSSNSVTSSGLDEPVLTQYGRYLTDLLSGDLGISFRFGEPVAQIILSRFPATLQLAMLSLAFGALLAMPMGILAARKPGGWAGPNIDVSNAAGNFAAELRSPGRSPSSYSPSCWAGCQFQAVPDRHILFYLRSRWAPLCRQS